MATVKRTKKELKIMLGQKKSVLNLAIASRRPEGLDNRTIACTAIDIYNLEQRIENMYHKLSSK